VHLRNVEIFCDVVTRRSFSKAADAHHVSQSAASQAVHQLEKRMGMKLIDRSKRPFELTSAGQIYFDGCRELLESFRRVEDRVRQAQNKVAGRVRVAAIYSVGLLQMDAYARRFHELYPETQLELDYLHPDVVSARILDGDADLGLVSFPRSSSEISVIAWQEQPISLVTPPGHRLVVEEVIPVEKISGENFVGFTPELKIRRQIDRWLKRAKVSVNVVHEFDNIENIKRAVEIGSGIALLPTVTVQRELAAGSLRSVTLGDVTWSRPLGIIHKRNRTLKTAVVKLVELLGHEERDAEINRPRQKSGNSVPAGTMNADLQTVKTDRNQTISNAPL